MIAERRGGRNGGTASRESEQPEREQDGGPRLRNEGELPASDVRRPIPVSGDDCFEGVGLPREQHQILRKRAEADIQQGRASTGEKGDAMLIDIARHLPCDRIETGLPHLKDP